MIRYYKLLSALALMGGGTLKAIAQNKPTDPFALFWCTSTDVAASGAHELALWHCWGCYVALAGCAMLVHSIVRGIPVNRRIQVRMR